MTSTNKAAESAKTTPSTAITTSETAPLPESIDDFPAVRAARAKRNALEVERRQLEAQRNGPPVRKGPTPRENAEALLAGETVVEHADRDAERRKLHERLALVTEALEIQKQRVGEEEDVARRELRGRVEQALRNRVLYLVDKLLQACQAQASVKRMTDRLQEQNADLGLDWNVLLSPIDPLGMPDDLNAAVTSWLKDLAMAGYDLSGCGIPANTLVYLNMNFRPGCRQHQEREQAKVKEPSLLNRALGFVGVGK